jgi:ankyrin repeat protein
VAGDLTDDELTFLAGVFDLARDGRHEELSGLVDQGVPVNLTNGSGDTLLILAAYHDHPATVRVLLERGADSRRVSDRGQTALGAAVFRRSVPSVQLLLASGADPDAGGRSARQISAFFDLPEMATLLGPVPATPREGADHD